MPRLTNHFMNTDNVTHDQSNLLLRANTTFKMDLRHFEGRVLKTLNLPERPVVVKKGDVTLRSGHYHLDDLELAELTLPQRHSLYKNESSLFQELRVKAEAGDPIAQYELGSYYRFCFESKDDVSRALDLFKKSADQGHVTALMEYVDLVLSSKKSQFIQASGNQDDLDAESIAFVQCVQGLELPSDEILVTHMRYLISQGHVRFHQDLAHLYYVGWGVPQDLFMAFVHHMYSLLYCPEKESLLESEEFFQEQLESICRANFEVYDLNTCTIGEHIEDLRTMLLSLEHYEDIFVEEFDFEKLDLYEKVVVAFVMTNLQKTDIAFKWFQNISEQRQHPCLDLMMGTYLYHQPKDDDQYELAHHYLIRSSEENPINLIQLAELTFNNADYQNAVKYFEQAADAGVKFALQRLAEIHRSGVAGKVDYKKAQSYLSNFVFEEVEDEKVLYLQGKMYLKGQSVEADEARATSFIQKAAYLGHVQAQYRLGCIFERQNNIDMMLYWWLQATLAGHRLASLRSGLFFLSRLDQEKGDMSLATMSFERVYSEPGQKIQELIDLGLQSTLSACLFALREKPTDSVTKALVELTVADIYYLMGTIYHKLAFVEQALNHYEKSKQLGHVDELSLFGECQDFRQKLLGN